MPSSKILYILRHAETEAGGPQQEDRQRRLTARGRDDAAAMGAYLREQGIAPDHVLCSTAARARSTWEGLALPADIVLTDALYLASPEQMLSLIADRPETTRRLLVIGHNPGLHELCLRLARRGDAALRGALAQGLPTCTLAAIALNGPWKEIAAAHGELERFIAPAQLPRPMEIDL